MTDAFTVSSAVSDMQARAAVCNTLCGGTPAMRKAGKTYLPQEPAESNEAWEARMAKSTLFPAFRDSVDAMVGKPLGEPITVQDVPASIEAALENADLAGRDLDTFAREFFRQSMVDGIGWVLVDYPRVPPGLTLAQEKARRARPYLIHVPLANVLGWRSEVVAGVHRLTQFRYMETVEVPDGEFGTKTQTVVRVWEPGSVRVFRKGDGVATELDQEASGPVTMAEIPVACFAPGRTGFMAALPPLEDLAWLNVQHWQSSSDQRHVLHVARVPLLGADKDVRDVKGGKIEVSPNGLIVGFENLRYIEHTGAAISAGRQDLLDLQEQMRTVAGKVLTRQAGGDKSATEASLESQDGGSKLRQWAWSFQDCLEECLRLMAAWIKEPQGGSVTVAMDWDDLPDPAMFQTILQARQAGELSRESWLWNAQRFGALPPGRTLDQEQAALDSEGPSSFGNTTP